LTSETWHCLSMILDASQLQRVQTLLLVGSHAGPSCTVWNSLPSFVYAMLTVSLVLGLSSRRTCSDICSRSAVRASDTLIRSFTRHYKFITYLVIFLQRTGDTKILKVLIKFWQNHQLNENNVKRVLLTVCLSGFNDPNVVLWTTFTVSQSMSWQSDNISLTADCKN